MPTFAQTVKKALYPLIMLFTKNSGKGLVLHNSEKSLPNKSFFDLKATLNNGKQISFSQWKEKKVLIVNTASDCGYTRQYEELQALQLRFASTLVVIGFPANDFEEQEKGTDEEIMQFCKLNYGISFPLSTKTVVIKSAGQNDVFRWLTDKSANGWNDKAPSWNFSKYLVDERGTLTHYFDPSVSPLGKEVISAIGS